MLDRIRVAAIRKLKYCTSRLVDLYNALPRINAIRDYGCGYDHIKDEKSQQCDEQPQQQQSHPRMISILIHRSSYVVG
jgi:hypothetical protein